MNGLFIKRGIDSCSSELVFLLIQYESFLAALNITAGPMPCIEARQSTLSLPIWSKHSLSSWEDVLMHG